MSGRYLTDLADVLRRAGQTVVELDGWQTRARSSGGYNDGGPWCVMLHHTASNGDGAADANYCTFGSSDRPVCNLVLGRDATWYACAAGATNTNGKGGPLRLADGRTVNADQMNLRAVAIEMSNDGIGMAYPVAMVDAMFAGLVALGDAYLGGRYDLAAGHVDWTTRKIDPATAAAVDPACGWRPGSINSSGSWRLADWIAETQRRAANTPTPIPPTPDPEDDDVKLYLVLYPGTSGQFVTDLATFKTPIASPAVAWDGVACFGWNSPNPANADPWAVGPDWAPFLDALPTIGA